MVCPQFEERILSLDQLPPAGRDAVETHLAACPGCSDFARQWQGLDALLARRLRAPRLSAAFDPRLRQRIRALSAPLSEPQRAERKRHMEAEFASALPRWRWLPANPHARIQLLAWAVLVVWALFMAGRFLPRGADIIGALGVGPSLQTILLGSVLGALFLPLGLLPALVFRQCK